MSDERSIAEALAAPFPPDKLGWKPQTVSGSRALAVAFIDARDVMDRLDQVVGPFGWRDGYVVLPDGNVVCTLELRCGDGPFIPKSDTGGESDQKDDGDKRKAAFSDALKRAAVKWGIGRYIYSLPSQWLDFDPKSKQIVGTPKLPPWAVPGNRAAATPDPRSRPAQTAQQPVEEKPAKGMPATGEELERRLADKDQLLAAQGKCKPGDLMAHVVAAGVRQGLEKDLAAWTGAAIRLAIDETKAFEARCVTARANEEQQQALDGELRRTGETWVRCRAKLGQGAPQSMDDLSVADADRLLALLREVPDAPAAPAKGGKK